MSKIQKARKKAGLTQRALAVQMGVAEITVRTWENGSRFPRLPKLRALARIFKCTPGSLI